VRGVPDGVEIGNLVCEKFDKIKSDGDSQDDRVTDNFERIWQVDDTEALEKAESSDSRVKVEAGREAGAESEAESFKRVHGGCLR
jgi:hypothetical protein